MCPEIKPKSRVLVVDFVIKHFISFSFSDRIDSACTKSAWFIIYKCIQTLTFISVHLS